MYEPTAARWRRGSSCLVNEAKHLPAARAKCYVHYREKEELLHKEWGSSCEVWKLIKIIVSNKFMKENAGVALHI